MLWCKATFAAHFSDAHCRLFPTQQQMFDFIDGAPNAEAWMPFGIEFPSEAEVSRTLTHRSTANAKPLFSHKREREENAQGEEGESVSSAHSPDLFRRRRCMREDFSVLYGTVPLSQQSRMFLAATPSGLADVVQTVEPLQQHLYEVIREGTPCHAYMDVEREKDYAVHVIDSSSSDANSVRSEETIYDEHNEEKEEEEETLRGGTLLRSEGTSEYVWDPERSPASMCCCSEDCRIRADNSATTEVLLAELQSFLLDTSPSFLASARVDEADETDKRLEASLECPLESAVFPLEVLVLRSTGGAKFSQHYILKLRDWCFRHNADVGCFIAAFVRYLYARAARVPRVHAALFYHAPPQRGRLPLRCVIDQSVYSRNRMLRCLGSCKLHKTAVLALERRFGVGARARKELRVAAIARENLFFATLVTRVGGAERIARIDLPAHTPYGAFDRFRPMDDRSAVCFSRAESPKGFEALAAHISRAWTDFGGVRCRVSAVRRATSEHKPLLLLMMIDGSRFCARVGREHRSNRVYARVDLERGVWAQKCWDPECRAFRSPERTIPQGVLMLTPREVNAARRTVFRAGES